jgi:hypothetical protein
VVNEYGEIVFLTRLFDEEEFSEMINVVETLVSE